MPSPLASRILSHVAQLAKEELHAKNSPLASHLDKCMVSGCDRFTIGGVCSQCSRHACTNHLYASVNIPPSFHCAECIAAEFEVDRER